MYDLTYSQTVYDRGKCSVSTEVQQFSNRIIFESNESFISNLPSENFLICDRKNLIGSTKTSNCYLFLNQKPYRFGMFGIVSR
jgi:hypothetical protein